MWAEGTEGMQEEKGDIKTPQDVILAEAGIQLRPMLLDSRLRGNDEKKAEFHR